MYKGKCFDKCFAFSSENGPIRFFQNLNGKSLNYTSSRPEVFCGKGALKISQNSQENTCARVSFCSWRRLQLY